MHDSSSVKEKRREKGGGIRKEWCCFHLSPQSPLFDIFNALFRVALLVLLCFISPTIEAFPLWRPTTFLYKFTVLVSVFIIDVLMFLNIPKLLHLQFLWMLASHYAMRGQGRGRGQGQGQGFLINSFNTFNVHAATSTPMLSLTAFYSRVGCQNPGGGGALPYICYIGMCRCEG